jgi:hypothetical protein
MNNPNDSLFRSTRRPTLRLVVSNPSSSPTSPPSRPRRPVAELDPFTRCYRRFTSRLRAACLQYVTRDVVDDLLQDVWLVASRSPAKLAQSDARTLAWLIGVAKKCARSYEPDGVELVPLDELLAQECGDDLEGRALYEHLEDTD